MLVSVLEDELTLTSKKTLRFLAEQLGYVDGTSPNLMTFSTALVSNSQFRLSRILV